MGLEELLAEADALMEAVEPITVPVKLGKKTVGVRFMPMDGPGWRTLVRQHPPRSDIPEDAQRGYNIESVVAAYPSVALIIGDQVDDMYRDADAGRVSLWPETWGKLTATGRKDVADEIWAAHELLPELFVGEAGKD